jgi:hypothetical protein
MVEPNENSLITDKIRYSQRDLLLNSNNLALRKTAMLTRTEKDKKWKT